jgi:ribosome biogenesis GTPase A
MEKKYINKLKKIIANNYNILLVGNTNVGKSTLINEFLNLSNSRKEKRRRWRSNTNNRFYSL